MCSSRSAAFCSSSITLCPAAARHWSFAEFIKPVRKFLDSYIEMTADLTLLLATLAIMTGALVITGVPTKLGAILIEAAGVNLAAMVVLAFVFGALLGTGLPPAPTYILVAIVIAPPMIKVGVNPWVVHFFAFFLGVWGELDAADLAGRGRYRQDRQCVVLHDPQPRAANLRLAVHADGRRVRASGAGDRAGTRAVRRGAAHSRCDDRHHLQPAGALRRGVAVDIARSGFVLAALCRSLSCSAPTNGSQPRPACRCCSSLATGSLGAAPRPTPLRWLPRRCWCR